MRVFLAGGTGVIGRRLIPKLLQAGHATVAMTRTAQGAARSRALGAEAVLCDVFDQQLLIECVRRAAPEVVVHQLTAIPRRLNPRRVASELDLTNRLRMEGTRNLMAAAMHARARRFVAQSIAFVHRPGGSQLKTESDPLYLDAPPSFRQVIEAIAELESATTEFNGIQGVALRYGFFYGPGTVYDCGGSFWEDVKKRRIPIVGAGGGVFSFVHVDDAADATLDAIESRATGVFHIVDDDPAPVRDWLPFYAHLVGAPRPLRVPVFLTRLLAGPYGVYLMVEQNGISNSLAKATLGWRPAHARWREGFQESLTGGPTVEALT